VKVSCDSFSIAAIVVLKVLYGVKGTSGAPRMPNSAIVSRWSRMYAVAKSLPDALIAATTFQYRSG
jgi:hypothetical protein